MSLVRKTILVLAALAATCHAQHIQFGPLLNQGDLVTKPAIDSKGNVIAVGTTIAPGSFGSPGRLVNNLVRYGRDASALVLADKGVTGSGDGVVFLAVDSQDRIYIGQNRQGEPRLLRFDPDETRHQADLFVPFTQLVGMSFDTAGAELHRAIGVGAPRAGRDADGPGYAAFLSRAIRPKHVLQAYELRLRRQVARSRGPGPGRHRRGKPAAEEIRHLLDPGSIATAALYDPKRLGTLLDSSRREDFSDVTSFGRVLTLEATGRACAPA